MTIPAWNYMSDEDMIRDMSKKFERTCNYQDDGYQIDISRTVTVPRTENATITVSLQNLVESGALSPLDLMIEEADSYMPYINVDELVVERAIEQYITTQAYLSQEWSLDWEVCDCEHAPTEIESPVIDGWDHI